MEQGSAEGTLALAYTGFWRRFWASMIDGVLICVIVYPVVIAVYGWGYFSSQRLIKGPLDFLLTWVLPAIAEILFWRFKGATPGKMVFGARIVDAATGGRPSTGQLIGRYFAYFISMVAVCLGFLWVGWDRRKQGWHDKLAGTVVVGRVRRNSEPVRFGEGA